ncbi:TRAP transporter small permease [Sediminivirga luteola]|uniref:TRAP transporter small permease n=1 Tax=Sediminivirga luteola TaxID=1774748 RepID=UPI001F58A132|nr:TRAP transporter small permease [Sediminivirga luteola]MCI2264366.1 TRAP transporter small permease [Sediminivirga luteola]
MSSASHPRPGRAPGEGGADRPLLGPRGRSRLRPVARVLLAAEGGLGVVVVAIMAALLIAQVAARNLLPFSFFWAEEVARLALIWMTMLGVAYAVGRGTHLTVTAITDYAPPAVRPWFQRVSLLLIVAVGILLCGSSLQLMDSIGGVAASSSAIPRSVYFLASATGYGLAAVHAALVLLIGPLRETAGSAAGALSTPAGPGGSGTPEPSGTDGTDGTGGTDGFGTDSRGKTA